MAKLNKQEVNAIAGKLHRELEKAAVAKREEAMKSYVPSEGYRKALELARKREVLQEQRDALDQEIDKLISDLGEHMNETYGMWYEGCTFSDKLKRKIIDKECSLGEVPEIEALKEDVTIAAIDDSFNTASFIEEQLAKFK